MNKKYLLFDNDGVLVDTEKWYYEANKMAMKELGIHLELDYYLELMTYGGNWWQLALDQGYSLAQIDQARARRSLYYQKFLTTENIFIPGVEKTLSYLSKFFKMSIITTSRRVDFELIHKEKNLTRYMDFILCEEDYPRAKPYPDPYLKGLSLFDASAEETLVIEDSQRGLQAAYSAGIECVIVHNDFTQKHDFSKASFRIETLNELVDLLL